MSIRQCAAVGLADGIHGIQSVNIVGYNTVTLKPGYNMLAANFQNVGDSKAISLQELIQGTTAGLTGATAVGKADKIQVYDPISGEYADFWLYYNARNADDPKNYKWIDASDSSIAKKEFANGDSFWFYKRGKEDSQLSFSGQVSTQEAQSIDLVTGWNMIGSAFPLNFNPNTYDAAFWKSAIAAGAVAATAVGKSDKIQVYNAASGEYADYWLYNNARNADDTKNGRWIDAAEGDAIDTKAEVIPTGKGAWYYHRGSGYRLSLTNPIE